MNIHSNNKKSGSTVALSLGIGICVGAVSWICFFGLIMRLGYVHEMPAVVMGLLTGSALVLAAVALPFFIKVTRRRIIPALGHYHWTLLLSSILAVTGFVMLFNMPSLPLWGQALYIIPAAFLFALGVLSYMAIHYKLALRIVSGKSELDKLDKFWLVTTAIVTLITVAVVMVFLPFDRFSITNISFVAGTIMLLSTAATFFGTYSYLPKIEVKEADSKNNSYVRALGGNLKKVAGKKRILRTLSIGFKVFCLIFAAVTVVDVLIGLSSRGIWVFATNPALGAMSFVIVGLIFLAFGFWVGYKVIAGKKQDNIAKIIATEIIFAVSFVVLAVFGVSGVISVVVGFLFVPVMSFGAGLTMVTVSKMWEGQTNKEGVSGEDKRILTYFLISCVGGLSLVAGGAAISLAALHAGARAAYIVFFLPMLATGIVLLIVASQKSAGQQRRMAGAVIDMGVEMLEDVSDEDVPGVDDSVAADTANTGEQQDADIMVSDTDEESMAEENRITKDSMEEDIQEPMEDEEIAGEALGEVEAVTAIQSDIAGDDGVEEQTAQQAEESGDIQGDEEAATADEEVSEGESTEDNPEQSGQPRGNRRRNRRNRRRRR